MGRIYRFSGFQLHAASRELRRSDGNKTLLPARVFDCILYLIEHRARAVGRDELIAAVWNQTEVGDNVLAQLLARTRKILDDGGDEQRIIRTVPGFGYHWVADTDLIEASTSPDVAKEGIPSMPPASIELAPATRRKSSARLLILIALVSIIIVVAAGAVVLWRSDRAEQFAALPTVSNTSATASVLPMAQRPALVLPAIIEQTEGQGWFRLGVMAFVAERLDGRGRTTVPSDNSVALMRGRDTATMDAHALAELAESAGANWIVQPKVEAVGSGWRVGLAIVHGQAPIKLSVSADGEQVLDAAQEAVDRLLAGVGEGASLPVDGVDADLVVVLKRAQAAYLDGKPEAARVILDAAQATYGASTELAYELGRMEYITGRHDAAKRRFEALLAAPALRESVVLRARTLNALAQVCYQRRDFTEVERYSRQVIDLLQNRGEGTKELGRAWSELANLASSTGRYEQSLSEGARARVLLAASGDWLGVTRNDALSGVMLRRAGRLAESIPVLSRAADRLQAFHEASHEGVIRSHIVVAWSLLAEPQAGLAQEPRLHELDSRIENPSLRAAMKLIRADLLQENGRTGDAVALVAQAYPQIIREDDQVNRYFAHALASRVALASGESARAEKEAVWAIEHLSDPEEDPRHVAQTYLMLVRLQAAHDVASAQRSAESLTVYIDTEPRKPVGMYRHLADAAVAVASNDASAARTAFEQAQSEPALVPLDRLRVAEAYVPWLLEHGEPERAAEIVGALGDITYRNYNAALLEVQLYLAARRQSAWQSALDRADVLANERQIDPALRSFPGRR